MEKKFVTIVCFDAMDFSQKLFEAGKNELVYSMFNEFELFSSPADKRFEDVEMRFWALVENKNKLRDEEIIHGINQAKNMTYLLSYMRPISEAHVDKEIMKAFLDKLDAFNNGGEW